MVVLVPADNFGIFVASNSLPGLGDFLFEPLMTHLAGPAVAPSPPMALPDAIERAPRFAGTYRDYKRTRNEMSQIRALMPMIQSRVIAEPDGAIRWQGRRWLQVEPLVFRRADSADYIVFREDGRGDVAEIHTSGGTYERIAWWEQTPFHVGLLGSCVIAFLAYPLSRGVRALRRRNVPREGRAARRAALFVVLTNLAFVAGLACLPQGPGRHNPSPAADRPVALAPARERRRHGAPAGLRRQGVETTMVDAPRASQLLGARRLRGGVPHFSQLLEASGYPVLNTSAYLERFSERRAAARNLERRRHGRVVAHRHKLVAGNTVRDGPRRLNRSRRSAPSRRQSRRRRKYLRLRSTSTETASGSSSAEGVAGGVESGIEGGVSEGIAGGIVGGLVDAPPPPPPRVRCASAGKSPRRRWCTASIRSTQRLRQALN